MLPQLYQQLLLRRLKTLERSSAQLQQLLYRFRYLLQTLQQLREILLSVKPLLVVLGPALHQQTADLVLHLDRLVYYQVAIPQHPPQFANLARRHPARRQ
jgi:hypothetical protein